MKSLFSTEPDLKQISFEEFYKLYPKKISRSNAEKSFNRLGKKEKQLAYDGIIKYNKFWITNKTEPQYIPYPATWLNQKRWEDELVLPKVQKPFQLDASGNSYLGYCSRCNISDFYHKDDLTGDSRCCKVELMPERRKK